jgi:hypothetical protein
VELDPPPQIQTDRYSTVKLRRSHSGSLRAARQHPFHQIKFRRGAKATPRTVVAAAYTTTFAMGLDFPNQVFRLPNARRMIVERFGVRITDKQGNTILESGQKREITFDRSLNDDDRRLLSDLKIGK